MSCLMRLDMIRNEVIRSKVKVTLTEDQMWASFEKAQLRRA